MKRAPRGNAGRGRPRRPHQRRRREEPDARLLALEVLAAVESKGAYSDVKLERALAGSALERRDRDLATALVQDTLRRRGTIDWILGRAVRVDPASLPVRIRTVLRLGVCQLFFMDRVPPHAAVNESVRLARRFGHPGTVGLVNAVLRRLADLGGVVPEPEGLPPDEALAVRVSHPLWLLRRWIERYGVEGATALAESNNRPVRLVLRANRTRIDRDGLIEALRREGVEAEPGLWNPDSVRVLSGYAPAGSAAFRAGLAVVQDEAESLVGGLLAAGPSDRVADLCAAPGAKATHLAERAGPRGLVVATDVVPARTAKIREAGGRLGLSSLAVAVADALHYPSHTRFAAVLLDAPCSGLGVLGRRADARWRKSEESIARSVSLQGPLLAAAGERVQPGGSLVYSVCSLEPEEGWGVVRAFLAGNASFEVESARGLVPDGMLDEHGALRALPHAHGTDGVFAVRLRRRGR